MRNAISAERRHCRRRGKRGSNQRIAPSDDIAALAEDAFELELAGAAEHDPGQALL